MNTLIRQSFQFMKSQAGRPGIYIAPPEVDVGTASENNCIKCRQCDAKHFRNEYLQKLSHKLEKGLALVATAMPTNLLARLKRCCRYALLVCSHKESTLKTLQPEKKSVPNNHKNPLNKHMTVVVGKQCKHKGIPKQALAFLYIKKYLNTWC